MKTIINRKRYDTNTATLVASWNNGRGRSDFRWCKETLYITPGRHYFLHGEGGPQTRYAESVGDMWGSGERIRLLTHSKAAQWLEDRECYDALEVWFDIQEG